MSLEYFERFLLGQNMDSIFVLIVRAHTTTLTVIPRGFEVEVFTGVMLFLSHNQQ